MTRKKCFLLLLLSLCQFALGQMDTIHLKHVIISDTQLNRFSKSKTTTTFTDSIVQKNAASLTSLLNYNSTIYFKENGLGMVSSPSFRGTTAQQTAVIWNGININSQLNGQTDFNTIVSNNYNSIVVRAGGGSSIYGSSAIGGSIHLNNSVEFKKQFSNQFFASYGSFNTLNANYKFIASDVKWSSQIVVSRNSSDNDYPYLNTNLKNENGQFYNTSLNAILGYKINPKSHLKFYSQWYDGERNFSGTLAAPSKSKYTDLNFRNLAELMVEHNAFVSTVKAAYLSEKYQYFEDKDQPNFSFGKAETALLKYDLLYRFSQKITFNTLFDYTHTKGFGSDLNENRRGVFSSVFLMKHQLLNQLSYEINFRKEVTNNYESPFLYSIGLHYNATKYYHLKFNYSKNFRIPTFNDLYWQQGGNPDLKPETAHQFELSQEIKLKNTSLSVTGFYNSLTDLISWKPNEMGLWQPINTEKVTAYGLEANLNYKRKLNSNHSIELGTNYSYTISENEQTQKQLIYVPYHKMTASVAYSYKKITFYSNYLFNGQVFTSLDNGYKLKEYTVVNSGIEYDVFKKCTLGFRVQNVFNENYQSVAQRPFPGRNYTLNFNINL